MTFNITRKTKPESEWTGRSWTPCPCHDGTAQALLITCSPEQSRAAMRPRVLANPWADQLIVEKQSKMRHMAHVKLAPTPEHVACPSPRLRLSFSGRCHGQGSPLGPAFLSTSSAAIFCYSKLVAPRRSMIHGRGGRSPQEHVSPCPRGARPNAPRGKGGDPAYRPSSATLPRCGSAPSAQGLCGAPMYSSSWSGHFVRLGFINVSQLE